MPDPVFAERRLAEIYDPLDPVRDDLDVYAEMVAELEARTVLDIGCGTGTFACLLAARGRSVVGVDPAAASLDVARRKPCAGEVTWINGDATTLPPLEMDLATMTANVAQVFVADDDWCATLHGVLAALRPGGRLVFETRDPAAQAWQGCNRAQTHSRVDIAGIGVVESWCDLTGHLGSLVSFRWTYVFEMDGAVLTSDSTLRFRERGEIEESLHRAGYEVEDLRDAPDRPGLELVYVAVRPT